MLDACERSPSHIRAIAPYQPGKPISELAREMGLDETGIVKLASNENPLGASPLAQRALDTALADLARYPDGSGFKLKQALAARYNLEQAQIVLGNGSNDVLEMTARAFLDPTSSAVFSRHAFAVYPLATQAAGARSIEVPAREFGHDLDAMASALRDDTKIVWIANPNNPTGTFAAAGEVERLLARVPQRVIVVLDEAYYEYLPDTQRADTVRWLADHPNLVITRTFSKAYGLAGLRVGYALAHAAVADLLNRVRQPFNVSTLAQTAATAALSDEAFVHQSRELNAQGLRQIIEGLRSMALDYIPSAGNFLSVRVGRAPQVYQALLEQGVIVRPIGGYGLPEHLRVSVGTATENERFLSALRPALHA